MTTTPALALFHAAREALFAAQALSRIAYNDVEYTAAVRAYHAATQLERGCDDCHWTHDIQACPAIRAELMREAN